MLHRFEEIIGDYGANLTAEPLQGLFEPIFRQVLRI